MLADKTSIFLQNFIHTGTRREPQLRTVMVTALKRPAYSKPSYTVFKQYRFHGKWEQLQAVVCLLSLTIILFFLVEQQKRTAGQPH